MPVYSPPIHRQDTSKTKPSDVLRIVVGIAMVVAIEVSNAHAQADSAWTESIHYDISGPGTYNSSFVSIFTAGNKNTVVDINSYRTSAILESFNKNTGLVLVNQDTGNLNQQVNIQSYAIGGLAAASVVDLASLGAHVSTGNITITVGGIRKNEIIQSFQSTTGVVSVNQTSGSLNSQVNVFQFGLGLSKGPGTIALDDRTLATVTTQNTGSEDRSTSKSDVIAGNSFDRFSGVAQVTQSSGDQNAIRNTTSITMTVRTIK